MLTKMNFEALRLLYAYLCDSPFQIPSISIYFSQNINSNSTIIHPNYFFPPNLKLVELGFMFWGKRLILMAIERVSHINRRTTTLKLQNYIC